MKSGVSIRVNQLFGSINPGDLLRAGDMTTAEGRSKERYRRAFLTTVTSGLSKLVAVSTALISVPLTLRYLGVERYGLWMTISSLIAFLGFSDFGINNGLMNGISRAYGREDLGLARQYISSAFFLLTVIALSVGLLFAIAYPWISWSSFFRVKSPLAMAEAGPAVAAFVVCFLIGIPTGIVTRVQSGYQEGFAANLWTLLGSLGALLAVILVIHLRGSLLQLVLALAGTPILAVVINGSIFFRYQRPKLRPSWSYLERGISVELLRSGTLFFVLQLAMAIGYSSDNIVLTQILGPAAVTQYSIPAKLFGLINLVGSFIVAPLWPAYSEALVRRDNAWVRRTLWKSVTLLLLVATVLSTLLVVFGHQILAAWVGPNIRPSTLLLAALGIWSLITALSMPIAVLLNAASVMKFQVTVVGIAAITNIALSIFLTRRIGVSGVVFGSIVSQSVVVLLPYFIFTRKFLSRLRHD
jgi:O-antigen/teichoic acid export membrane protein